MATSTTYKKYRRGRREQLPDENFNLGMIYSNTPLQSGAAKCLVNYDVKNSGVSVSPRRGLRSYRLAINPNTVGAGITPIVYTADMAIMDGKVCAELDKREYGQIIIGEPTDTLLTGTKLYKGKSYTATVYPKGEAYAADGNVDIVLQEDVEAVEIHLDPIADNIAQKFCVFTKPQKAEAHGLALTDLSYITRQVGAFAFGNSYYTFRHVVNGIAKLVNTKLTKAGETNFYSYLESEITPKVLTPKEAVMWGYNMLATNPYTFSNTETAGTIQFNGMLPYDTNNNLLMSPQINQNIVLKCNYSVTLNKKYTVVWEWKESGADTWTKLKEEDITFATLVALEVPFSTPLKEVMVRISAYKWTDGVKDSLTEQVLTVGFNFDKEAYGSTANVEAKIYDLSKATGMSYWKNRLAVWLDDMLFLSEVNDPSYMPYPNNTEIFDEPIIYGMQYLDYFLVWTATQLHILTLSSDGLSWTKKCLQGNLSIQEWDIHLIKVVKNMVFFKSGNYFYMVVPSQKNANNLVIAPISKNIEFLLDNFGESVTAILDAVYDYRSATELVHYYNFLDYEDVHNVYVFKTIHNNYINLDLLYDINLRNWRIYLIESEHILVPFRQDATKKGVLMSLLPIAQTWNTNVTGTLPAIQFLQFTNTNVKDFYIPANLVINPFGTSEVPLDKFLAMTKFKNYQLIDSGYRDHFTDFKKRYREFQFKINNISQENLRFFSEFLIDGELRRSMYKYTLSQVLDPTDENYGVISFVRELIDPAFVGGTTILAENDQDINRWQLDSSYFPESGMLKVRIPVSGKGYSPRMRLISYNENEYELLNVTWIFRELNSR